MQYDCIIIGGGAVGASAALTLAQCDQRVLLIEKRPLSSIKPTTSLEEKTLALSYTSAKIYEALGLHHLIQEQAVPIKRVHVNQQGHYGSCRMDHHKYHVDYLGVVVGAHDLEYALYQALQKCTTVKIEPYKEGWKIGEDEAKLIIAADGADSMLRKQAYISVEEKEYDHVAISLNIKLKSMPPFLAVERFLQEGAIALLPWRQGWATCVWTLEKNTALDLMKLSNDAFRDECEKALGRMYSTIEEMGKRVLFPLKKKIAKNQFGARLLLLGNAAHSLHPIAAQGLNLSLRDLWQLRKQLKNNPSVDLGSSAFLEEYYCERKTDQRHVILGTEFMATRMTSSSMPGAARAWGITLMDALSCFKTPFARKSMGLII